MAEILTKRGESILMDDEDYEFLSTHTWRLSRGYAIRSGERPAKGAIYMHREVMGLQRGDASLVDHINGNRMDNRKANLRICSKPENGWNRGATVRNSSGYKGVSFKKSTGRFQARIKVGYCEKFLGSFDSAELAHAAYCAAADKLHGVFANYGSLAAAEAPNAEKEGE